MGQAECRHSINPASWSPIAIWEEDFSSFVSLIRQLEHKGIVDVKKYLTQHPGLIVEAFRKIKIVDVNKAALELYGAKSKDDLMRHFGKAFATGIIKVLIEEFIALAGGEKYFEAEIKSKTLEYGM